jgi:hypothetical protein
VTRLKTTLLLIALTALAACDDLLPSRPGQTTPKPPTTSAASEQLRVYYAHTEADLLTRGLLRTDGGGPDTPFTADMLARNFEQIAFFDEYARGQGLERSSGEAGTLRRWSRPVRLAVEFGPSVPQAIRTEDTAIVSDFTARLATITGHPISMANRRTNFHVMVMGEDDRDFLLDRVNTIIPDASTSTLSLFRNLPRSIHCLVVAFSRPDDDNDYRTAIALVRAEHPDLLRKSCYHEEISQGLGLANDSPEARPSIFNDDDEFALLTTHDEALLRILYDPRLSIGMPLDQARPIIRILAREQTGQNL